MALVRADVALAEPPAMLALAVLQALGLRPLLLPQHP